MNILASEFHIVNGVFMARSYHNDLMRHQMIFDESRGVVMNEMIGTAVRSITDHAPDSEFILNNYGQDVFNALAEYKARKK